MDTVQAAKLWEQVKANRATLESCAGHEFLPLTPVRPLYQRYRCAHCGGEVDAMAAHWYARGRAHVDAHGIVKAFILHMVGVDWRERLLERLARWRYYPT